MEAGMAPLVMFDQGPATTIMTNLTCNQRCVFCHAKRTVDDPAWLRSERIQSEVRAAAEAGVRRLLFSGGEPTLSPELANSVAYARDLGFAEIGIETNGMLLSYARLTERLRHAGLTHARVALHAWGGESDALTQSPGGFDATLRGLARASAAGLVVDLLVAIVASRGRTLPALVARAKQAVPGIRGVELRVIEEAGELVPSLAEVREAAVMVAETCREHDLACSFAPRQGVPWCLAEEDAGLLERLCANSRPRPEAVDWAACTDCAVRAHCAGVMPSYVKERSMPALHTLAVKPEACHSVVVLPGLTREVTTDYAEATESGAETTQRVLRVTFKCNQRCRFCFVDRGAPPVPHGRLVDEVNRARQNDVRSLSLSGGEPLLYPRLDELIEQATGQGLPVCLQTNATGCARRERAQRLHAAGLRHAFVSLHANTAELSDAITQAPGAFAQTVAGIDHLLAAGVQVTVNFVIHAANHHALVDTVRTLLQRHAGQVRINLSWVLFAADGVAARFSDARASVGQAIELCQAAGMSDLGLQSRCGLPLCFFEAAWMKREHLPPLPGPNPAPGFDKPPQCRSCRLNPKCHGVRSEYAALYGLSELAPVIDPA
jgi:molybdenum cofactor biosynthesis enzyme MoaA